MIDQEVVFTNDISKALGQFAVKIPHDVLYLLFDTETIKYCMPVIADFMNGYDAKHPDSKCKTIIIGNTDAAKNIATLTEVWQTLSDTGASRHSLMINVGGGMLTDLGGFAAATFKRGIKFINVPTTLLGAVDAAVGGKTGVNLGNLKNELGAFAPASAVLISTTMFDTLDQENLLSGYAEMLKHGFLSDNETLTELLNYDILHWDKDTLLPMLEKSVNVKRRVVRQDPYEQGLRKALNLGHTFGHAFESWRLSQGKPVLHGYAVAWGLVCELIVSHQVCGFPSALMQQVAAYVRDTYGPVHFTCDDYDALYELMTHDKKNEAGEIYCSLLHDVGSVALNHSLSKEQIFTTYDIFRDLMGI